MMSCGILLQKPYEYPYLLSNGTQFFRIFIAVNVKILKNTAADRLPCHLPPMFATVFAYHLHMVGCVLSSDVG